MHWLIGATIVRIHCLLDPRQGIATNIFGRESNHTPEIRNMGGLVLNRTWRWPRNIYFWFYATFLYEADPRPNGFNNISLGFWINGPPFWSFEPFGVRCCVVCVMWFDVEWWGGLQLVKVCIFHNKKCTSTELLAQRLCVYIPEYAKMISRKCRRWKSLLAHMFSIMCFCFTPIRGRILSNYVVALTWSSSVFLSALTLILNL